MLELTHTKLSVYYFFKDKLDDNGYGSTGYFNNELVFLMDSYPNDDELNRVVSRKSMQGLEDVEIVLPIVTIEYTNQVGIPFQLGSREATSRSFMITVMANDETEMDMLSQQIYEWLRDYDIPLNNYNSGFPPTVTPTQVGTLRVENVNVVPVRIVGSPDISDDYRTQITFDAVVYSSAPSEELFDGVLPRYYLTIIVTGGGAENSVSVDPAGISGFYYESGTTVILTAVPGFGNTFTTWAGSVPASTAESIEITMDSDKTVVAIFSGLLADVGDFDSGFSTGFE